MTKAIVVRERYTLTYVRNHKDTLFVFGDNSARVGAAGQAVIREEPNSFGIATKRYPSMTGESFFSDQENEFNIVNNDIAKLKAIFDSNMYAFVGFPFNGLGTGLAKMPIFSPELYRHLNSTIEETFGITPYPPIGKD